MLENLWLVEPGVVVICHNPKQLGRDLMFVLLVMAVQLQSKILFLELSGSPVLELYHPAILDGGQFLI